MKFELLLQQLHNDLQIIKKQHQSITKQARLSIVTCRKTLSEMNKLVLATCFIDEKEEIHFFKKIKVQAFSQLVYYSELRYCESNYPKTTLEAKKKYLERKLRKATKFFTYNLEFVNYVREKQTHLDTQYFTRKNYNTLNVTDAKHYYRAPEFSTSHDILLGKIYGYDYFINYLKNKLHNLQNPRAVNLRDMHKKSILKWKNSKTDLVELIYAIHSSGAIDADINELVAVAEELLNIKIGNPYRIIIEIQSRKISQTKYVDTLKKSLLKRFQELDQ